MPGKLARLLAEDDAREPFDAVVVEHCFSIEALPRLRRAVVVLDEHNVESEYYRGQALKNPFKVPEFITWRRYERSAWRKADQVVTVSARDARVVQQAEPKKGIVVANGTRVEAYRYLAPSCRTGSAVLYVGMMSYPPNVAAAVTLARQVLPALRQHVPDATLTIAGRDATSEVRALASEHVNITGTLPEVFSLFDRHAAYAMPLSQGAGSSLKVLEPFAAGLPLVASDFAVRGYGLDGSEYLRAEGVTGFVNALRRALTCRAELDAMAERGREVAERHSWSNLSREFAGVVRQMVYTRGVSPGGTTQL
jgi:glycosyltransferase involved in cell wall biosynthesis